MHSGPHGKPELRVSGDCLRVARTRLDAVIVICGVGVTQHAGHLAQIGGFPTQVNSRRDASCDVCAEWHWTTGHFHAFVSLGKF